MTKTDKLERIDMLQAELSFWKEMVLGEQKKRIQYPIVCRSINADTVVKFTGLNEGECLYNTDENFVAVGDKYGSFTRHTNTDVWEEIAYDEERGLYDKQVVWCWDYEFIRCIKFYDAINKTAFYSKDGKRNGTKWSNYGTVKQEQIPDFMRRAYDKLED